MTYAEYKDAVIDYMKYGDSFSTAHNLSCMNFAVSVDMAPVYKARLEKEIGDNFK